MNPLNYLPIIPLLCAPLLAANTKPTTELSTKCIDIKPESYPKCYAQFEKALKEQSKKNTLNFIPAMEILLRNCSDESAVDLWMEKASAAGIPAAEQFIGNQMLSGLRRGEEQSSRAKQAYKLIKQASDAGFIPAMINIAICQLKGIGTGKSEILGQRTLISACKSGDFFARYKWLEMNDRMSNMRDLERKEVQAEIKRKNPFVIHHASRIAGSAEERLMYLNDAVKLKHGEAIADLSAMHAKDEPAKSFSLLVSAAKQHNADAMAMLGSCLLNPKNKLKDGLDISPEDERSYGQFLLRLAATANSRKALNHLGRYYYEGSHGFALDKQRAFTYFTKASRMNDPMGILSKSLMVLMGAGDETDKKELLPMLNMLAMRGNAHAVVYMAYAYYKGVGVKADGMKAIETLQEAAAYFKMPVAYVYIAYIYTKGAVGVKVSEDKAKNFIRLASFDMGDRAQELYDRLVKEGEWILTF